MPISFDHPFWLVALVLVPAVVLLSRRATAGVPARQLRWATILRAVGVAALVLALAAPRLTSSGDGVDVAFLVDASDSVGLGDEEAYDFIDQALALKPGDDRAALALFGADARLEYTLRPEPPRGGVATVVDGAGSDLARALRLGQGVLGSDNRRRVVLFSDGRQTDGDAVRAAQELAEAGVRVDVVPLSSAREADVLVEEVVAPSRVRDGESFDVVGVLRNTGAEPIDVVVITSRDGEEVDRRTVAAEPGRTRVVVPQVADEGGSVRYEVRLSSGASAIADNDVARAAVLVDGPARVLVFEGEDGLGDDVARALDAGGVPTDVRTATADAFPELDGLLDYDSILLVDVPVSALGAAGMQSLDAYVRDAGRGLVAIGGDDSFGMGEYDATPLEDLLPVFARVKDPKKRPSVAEALVVDVSGSMAACHCRPDGFAGGGQMIEEGGVNKTDISKEAISRAIGALEQQDIVGVLAFNANAEWVIPLQNLPDEAVVDDALARLNPDGETNVVQAIDKAVAGLKEANARLRHIVLFTDGFSEDPEMVEAARRAAEAGITMSVVATGEGTGEVLRRMAEAGNGRYYPGRDLFSIPDIIVSEVQFAARPIITEGAFLPIVTGIAAATEDLTSTPPLFGYLATTAKPAARQLLQIGDERDPLLATWQAGLGTVTAWTSDSSPRWAQDWVSWDQFQTFWASVVKDTLPGDPNPDFQLQATASGSGVRVTLETADALGGDVQGTATVTLPDGTRVEVPLERTDLNTFEAVVPGGDEGVYAVSGRLFTGTADTGTDVFRDAVTAIRSYSPEYALGEAEPGLLEAIAEAGGGVVSPTLEQVFAAEGLQPGSSSRALWPLLALLALLTLPADVAFRRLRLERDDVGRLRAWSAAAWQRTGTPEAAPERRTAATDGLFTARDRARSTLPTTDRPTPPPPDRGGVAAPPRPSLGQQLRDLPPPDAPPPADPPPRVPRNSQAALPPKPARRAGPPPPPPEATRPPPAAPRATPDATRPTPGGAGGLLDARRRARGDDDTPPLAAPP